MAGLSGTGRLADDLYLLAHNDINGKPFLQPRATGIGLAGALLAELVLSDHIRVGLDGITVVCFAPPTDELAQGAGPGDQWLIPDESARRQFFLVTSACSSSTPWPAAWSTPRPPGRR
jgi:hypothetical protein